MRLQTKYTLLSENGTTRQKMRSHAFRPSGSAYLRYGKADKNRFSPATLDMAPPISAVFTTPTLPAKIVYKEACIASQDRSFDTVHIV